MTIRFPVALWQDFAGAFTASVLDGAALVAYDSTAAGALAQLERYLAWAMRKGVRGIGPSDFIDLELRNYRIEVRPEYRVDETVYPVPETFRFRVTCVDGKRRDGTRHCVAPTLGIRLSYQPGAPIDQLMTEAIKQALGRSTPQELSRQLMPPRIELDAVHVREREPAKRETGGRFPALESVATLLGTRRRGFRETRAIARDDEVRQLVEQLNSSQANLLLLGESGCGKSTVLAEAVRQLRRRKPKQSDAKRPDDDDTPREERRQFWRTSGQRLIAGMKYLGQWEERCEQVIGELAETGSVLCVEELLELIRVGSREPGGSTAAFFQPYLERGELRMVAEATTAELDACRRLLPGFADAFQIVRVPEFSPGDARRVLDRLLSEGARNLRLELEPGLADLVYRLFRRFQPYAAFPGRSAAFVRHLLDHVGRRPHRGKDLEPLTNPRATAGLTAADVLAEFQRETGLPERLLRDDLPLPHEQVLDAFRAAVLGQEAACQAAAGVVTTLKTGLNDPQRPLGVLLFCGPTGVGKTEMAKALARYLFGASGATDRLLRLDMSEYAGPGAAQRLMFAADGGPSDFIKRARRQPFVVVLLDEIEKAAGEVHDALLGVLDEGRLTDRFGRVTTFRSTVIVMTSNVGADRSQAIGFDGNVPAPFERAVLERFRPEFVNRIDAIVTFEPLARDTIARLVERELESLAQREGLTKRNLKLAWTAEVVEHLAAAGFDARYGARPLQRALEQLVVAPLSRWLLANSGVCDCTIALAADAHGVQCAASPPGGEVKKSQ
jgi:ATP-dependent Clp protease ATP-binding subunit ClpC